MQLDDRGAARARRDRDVAYGLFFIPPWIGPTAEGAARTRDPGTNTFDGMTFSAGGTTSDGFKKRPGSQKRAFHKVDARDLAGDWRGCYCVPFVPLWPYLSSFFCTAKKALNQDQYEEKGLCCFLCMPCPFLWDGTRTRRYVNGHPKNGFFAANENGNAQRRAQNHAHWHRDPGCAGCNLGFCAKKVC